MLLVLLIANLVHGAVALVWIAGLRRVAGPLPPALWTDLLSIGLVLAPVATSWHLLELPEPPVRLVRAELWAEALLGAGAFWQALGVALLAGTAVLFLSQELWPAWRWRRGRFHAPHRPDPALDAVLARVEARIEALDVPRPRGRSPRIYRLETDERVAGLQGLVEPHVLISRGLLRELDDGELEAVVAHEVAHLHRGGNVRLLLLWIVRALQAPNPAMLVIFRSLLEAQEAACDAFAVRVTGRPATLASALLKAYGRDGRPAAGAGRLTRARSELRRRADVAATRLRVRTLLDGAPGAGGGLAVRWVAALVLGMLFWSIL